MVENYREISVDGMFRVRARKPIADYLKNIYELRWFVAVEARSLAFSASRGNYLGKIWIVLDPLLQVAIYAVVFGLILNTSRGMENFVGFLVLGVTFFGYFQRGINGAAGLLQRNRGLINSFGLPGAVIPLSQSIRQIIDGSVTLIVAIVVALAFQPQGNAFFNPLPLIALFFLVHVFVLGASFWVARITAFVPDFKNVVSVAMRCLFFVSGVFFTIDRFSTNPKLQAVVEANPIYQFLQLARRIVLDSETFVGGSWWYVTAWSVLLLISGFVFFWSAEGRYSLV